MEDKYKKALDCIVKSDIGCITIRNFFKELLLALFNEKECFSGKRALGDSGWDWCIYESLIENKILEGELYEDGYVKECDFIIADHFILNLIRYIFQEKRSQNKIIFYD